MAARADGVAIVPARGGSRGLPGKNLRTVGGTPLVVRAIEAGRAARCVSRVLVTTDSDEIAAVARAAGAEVPFRRPPELARDDTPGVAPVAHALRWLADHEGALPAWTVVLQPTSPLRTAADVDATFEAAAGRGADAAVSVCAAKHHPSWVKRLGAGGRLEDFVPGPPPARRQDLPAAYALNGAVYVARSRFVLEHGTLLAPATYAHVMPPERSVDVDTEVDLAVAECLLRRLDGARA
jgi:CMP-N-acetylneuraminic acid synthetase